MKNTSKTLKSIKENNQDFEWYPTTTEILRVIACDLNDSILSMLDIGAGNGQVFGIIEGILSEGKEHPATIKKYAIEKSKILIKNMPADVFIVGTDFLSQTLIDKKVDVIFCNPPYSEYVQWSEKIINEGNCKTIYLVIPERWKNQKNILHCINRRTEKKNGFKVLGSFDFENSEFREARARVDIVKINLQRDSYCDKSTTDPFEIWFEDNFKIKADKSDEGDFSVNQKKKEDLHEIVKGQNLIERLEQLYIADIEKLLTTYKKIEELDSQLLKEMEVNIESIKESLKLKIKNTKALYWQELFDNLNDITDKLTSNSRKSMFELLNENTNIDFSSDNAYAVILWVIKNANKYFDTQLVKVYRDLTMPEAVQNYKSNKNIISDRWRYIQKEATHYTLDYRIIAQQHYCFNESSYRSFDFPNGLSRQAHDFINDILIIGKNLSFDVSENTNSFVWGPGEEKILSCNYKGSSEEFLRVRAFKNGNIHMKFNQKFMMAFNIEASRINGWVKIPDEFSQETSVPREEVDNYFRNNLQIIKSGLQIILQ